MEEQIKNYFKENNLPAPVAIRKIGRWAKGECFAVTCGLLFLKKYCVYTINGEITSVRRR